MKNKRKILIIIISIILLFLVVVGLTFAVKKDDTKNDNTKSKTEENRCEDSLCVSNVKIEETDGQKSVHVIIKNEGTSTIEEKCIKVSSKDYSYDLCVPTLEKGEEIVLAFEYNEEYGNNIEDYTLEKSEKTTIDESAPTSENETVEN